MNIRNNQIKSYVVTKLPDSDGDYAQTRVDENGSVSVAELESTLKDALERARSYTAKDPVTYRPTLAEALTNWGEFLMNEGRLREAEQPLREAFTIYRDYAKADPGYKTNYADVSVKLADLFGELKRYSDAVTAGKIASTTYREILENCGDNVVDKNLSIAGLICALASLADVYHELKDPKAIDYCRETALVAHKYSDEYVYKVSYAVALKDWADYLCEFERYDEAEKIFQARVAVHQEMCKENTNARYDFAKTLIDWAVFLHQREREQQAEKAFKKAEELMNEIKDPDKDVLNDRLYLLNRFANFYWTSNQLYEAEPKFKQAVALAEKLVADGSEEYAPSLISYLYFQTQCLAETGRLPEATKIAQRSLTLARERVQKKLNAEDAEVARELLFQSIETLADLL